MLVFLVTSLSFLRDVHTTTKKHTYVNGVKNGLSVRQAKSFCVVLFYQKCRRCRSTYREFWNFFIWRFIL